MEIIPEIINIGEDRIVVAENAFYRVKSFSEEKYDLTLNQLAKILIQLPFSFAVVPLNSSSTDYDFGVTSSLVEVYPFPYPGIEIYPPSFRRIEEVRVLNHPLENKLHPDAVMCDKGGGGFRCSYHPKLKSFGISRTKPKPKNSSSPTADFIFIEIFKFNREDSRRIFSYIETLEDISEEASAMRRLEKIILNRRER